MSHPVRVLPPLWSVLLALLSSMSFAGGPAMAQSADPEAGEWAFAATLDGKPIGTHRFVVRGTSSSREVDSSAQLLVRVLGIPVYRYGHQAQERWQGDCLRDLKSQTDDDGKPVRVDKRIEGDCMMSFAYWNPRLPTQQRLVNPQTGMAEPVRIEPLPDADIEVRGRTVPARGWLLQAATQRIRVWYAIQGGRWIALDAEVSGGRTLSYRLPPVTPPALNDKDKP
jgi:hypothetical protein